jgi:NADPH:quinone reductase-like Zn-dependent oxidoreductase
LDTNGKGIVITMSMKAAVYDNYGPPEVIQIKDIEIPRINNSQILVKVHASSVNRTDDGFLRAKPAIVRLFSGLLRPRQKILGCEIAGEVMEVGAEITTFKVGDKVFGFNDVAFGGHAEYVVINPKDSFAVMPKNESFETMAGASEGSHYALSYVRTIQKSGAKSVLVHGATGAIGSAAVQLLKHAGMYVVATSNTKNMKLVKSLGADKVIDWEKEDFTLYPEKFDVVFDSVGKSSLRACKPLLNKKGTYIATELGFLAQNPILGLLSPVFKLVGAKKTVFPIPKNNIEIIDFLRDRVSDGSFRPVIDRVYTLESIKDAYDYVETGQKTGNVIIKII